MFGDCFGHTCSKLICHIVNERRRIYIVCRCVKNNKIYVSDCWKSHANASSCGVSIKLSVCLQVVWTGDENSEMEKKWKTTQREEGWVSDVCWRRGESVLPSKTAITEETITCGPQHPTCMPQQEHNHLPHSASSRGLISINNTNTEKGLESCVCHSRATVRLYKNSCAQRMCAAIQKSWPDQAVREAPDRN